MNGRMKREKERDRSFRGKWNKKIEKRREWKQGRGKEEE